VTVCGNSGLLGGPSSAPAGAVTVPAGDNSSAFAYQLPADTTYYFAAGTHYLGTGTYSQIQAGANDTFIGAPGAIISGVGSASSGHAENDFAIGGTVTGVTIEYLTIEDFTPPGSQGAVNPNSDGNWTIEYDTVQDIVPGSALMVGSNDTIEYNCLTENGQYAINAYQDPSDADSSAVTGGPQNIVLSDNEISYNDTCNFEAVGNFPIKTPSGCAGAGEANGCGCSGGGKFWHDQNVTVEDNYVHNNYNVGLWVDTDNDGFDIQGNDFSGNYGEALIYEVSYNALIKDNTFVDNTWGLGATLNGFTDVAIYISESGGDSRVPNSFGYSTLDIESNTFTNNWGGVALWENANRFCGDGWDDACTLVDPSVATMGNCPSGLAKSSENQPADKPDYFDLCRWKTQNVTVADNTFNFNPSAVGSDCTVANNCGFNGLFSEYGSTTPYTAWVVPLNISDHQNNVFEDNTYNGPWNFDGLALGDTVSWSQWTSGFDNPSGSGDFTAQDAGSTFNP
jgi:parallel beta-helix repeat protein